MSLRPELTHCREDEGHAQVAQGQSCRTPLQATDYRLRVSQVSRFVREKTRQHAVTDGTTGIAKTFPQKRPELVRSERDYGLAASLATKGIAAACFRGGRLTAAWIWSSTRSLTCRRKVLGFFMPHWT